MSKHEGYFCSPKILLSPALSREALESEEATIN